jgi:centromeric protein E
MGSNAHIPYRDSKLTRILQPSLGGNARTAIICTLSPATSHIEQSRNTLLFGSCAKEVVTNAQVNVVVSDKTLVKHLQKEVARLESELQRPASNATLEALVKEKNNQIKKVMYLPTFSMLLLCSYFADDTFKFMETIVLVHFCSLFMSQFLLRI